MRTELAEVSLELECPDLEPHRESTSGIEFVHQFDSHRPGPHLWINALTHGDEPCGAIAIDFLLRNWVPPSRGRVTLSFANVAAYLCVAENGVIGRRYVDEDLNRVWARLTCHGSSVELDRARQLRPIAESADYLLDLHSMDHPSEPLTIVGLLDCTRVQARGVALARTIGYPTLLVADRGHAGGLRLRDFGGFGDEGGVKTALVVECGASWQASSARTAIETAIRFLAAFECIDASSYKVLHETRSSSPFRLVEVEARLTVEYEDFQFLMPLRGSEVIRKAGTPIAVQGGHTLVTPFDDCFILMPVRRPRVGETAVRFGRLRTLEN